MRVECEEIKQDVRNPKISLNIKKKTLIIRAVDKESEELILSFTPKETERIKTILKLM